MRYINRGDEKIPSTRRTGEVHPEKEKFTT